MSEFLGFKKFLKDFDTFFWSKLSRTKSCTISFQSKPTNTKKYLFYIIPRNIYNVIIWFGSFEQRLIEKGDLPWCAIHLKMKQDMQFWLQTNFQWVLIILVSLGQISMKDSMTIFWAGLSSSLSNIISSSSVVGSCPIRLGGPGQCKDPGLHVAMA